MRRFEFPLLEKTTFLDSGAGTLKPLPVIEEIVKYYRDYPINIHSIDSKMGAEVYKKFMEARKVVADFVDADVEEVIFTSGTTDGLNRVARMFEIFTKPGDKIVVSKYNHSSNASLWVEMARRTGAKVVFSEGLIEDIDDKTKIVAYAQVNNTISKKIDHEALFEKVSSVGAVLVNDAAQAVNTEKVSLETSDVIVFSGTKIYGPTGIGALIIRKPLLDLLTPATVGGGAVAKYCETEVTWKTSVAKFEAGSLNIAGILGMAAGIKYMQEYDDFDRKKELATYAFNKLNELGNIEFFSKEGDSNVIFRVKGVASQDVVSYLGHRDIILRAGRHCALHLFESMNVDDTIRMSFGLYNNQDDIDKAVEAIKNGGDFLDGL